MSFTYDALARLARLARLASTVYTSGTSTTTISYSYDAAGNRSSVVTTTQ